MDDKAIYDNSGTNQSQPTTAESGTGEEQGANKREPVSISPSAGRTIVGRDVRPESSAPTESGKDEAAQHIDTEHSPDK